MLDRVEWESGRVLEWVDENEADILEIPLKTLRRQRQQLEKDGYITSVKGQYSQQVTVHNWTDPRKYDGKVINKSTHEWTPSEKSQSTHSADSPSESLPELPSESPLDYTADGNPSLYPHNTSHKSQNKDSRSNNKRNETIEAIIEVCHLSWDTFRANGKMRGLINRTTDILMERKISPEDIKDFYGFDGWWWKEHWAGRDKNSPPRPEQIADTIDQATSTHKLSETYRKDFYEGWKQD
jgi:hypothetical protein